MSATAYKDVAKLQPLGGASYFTSDGGTVKFSVSHDIAAVFIDGVKTIYYRTVDNFLILNRPPIVGALVVCVSLASLNFYLMSDAIGQTTEAIWVDATTDVYILSEDMSNNEVGELLFSLDDITYVSCLGLTLGNDIQVYVKALLAAPLNEIKTIVNSRIVIVESSTPLDTDGNLTVSFTVPGGDLGGVEIYEELM